MREEFLDIPTSDNKKIQCVYSANNDQPSQKAVLLAHGLTGHLNEHIHFVARDYFLNQGYDVYRMSFYAEAHQYRLLTECTLEIQASDMNTALECIKPKHDKIFICGHSYGGMTILFANPDVTANAFWDSSYMPWSEFWNTDEVKQTPDGDNYQVNWIGITQILSKNMFEEAKNLSKEDSKNLAQAIKAPSIVFNADLPNTKILYEDLTVEKAYSKIEADHCFTTGESALELMKQTHSWFEKF